MVNNLEIPAAPGASVEAVERLKALVGLPIQKRHAKGDNLEALSAFLGSGRYHSKQKLFNARFLISHILTQEGHTSAVLPEWFDDKRPHSSDYGILLRQEQQQGLRQAVAVRQDAFADANTGIPLITPPAASTASDSLQTVLTKETLTYAGLWGR